jgi:ATP-dependent Clp protease ATP-binding subunit ClpB
MHDYEINLEVLQKEHGILKEEVNAEDIARVVARWTGIPVKKMLETESNKLASLEKILSERIIGQKHPITSVANALRRSRAGVSEPNRPIGSFLFLGPTGVGKTELAKTLAEFMFDTEDALVRVDMSEYMEKHSVSKIIGSPPGYVGYEEGGQLTEIIRRRPYSVLLFDEIEKAHPDIFNILLQILDEGHVKDAKGRKVNFKNTIIIMTSNIGSQLILSSNKRGEFGFHDDHKKGESKDGVRDKVMEQLHEHFRPEFLNRIDEVIIFESLTEKDIESIVSLQLGIVEKRLQGEKKIHLEVDEKAKKFLAKEGFDPDYGARPLKRVLQSKLLDKLALKIIDGTIAEGDTAEITSINDELVIEKKQEKKPDKPKKAKRTSK